MLESVNPATGETIARWEHDEPETVERTLREAEHGHKGWSATSIGERAEFLTSVSQRLEKHRASLAKQMTLEMGKPIAAAEREVDKCAMATRWIADNAERLLAPETIDVGDDASDVQVRYDSLGPILAIMPWNFPAWQVIRAAVPAIAAGNVILLKHASNVQGCALAIEDIFTEAGAPVGLFSTVRLDNEDTEELIADDRVRGVTLTGSVRAGRAVAAVAGRHIKPSVLELGGSDPFVVLADADVAKAAEAGAKSRLLNNGESCIAAKRFIVHADVADEFTEAFVAAMDTAVVGDPLEQSTDVGPLAREDLVDTLHDQVTESVRDGAKIVLGGKPIDGPGFFYQPTVLTGARSSAPARSEETFGPVASVVRVKTVASAIRMANASRYGLGASLWTADEDMARRTAARLEAGNIFINDFVRSDPRVPFGGVKDSGWGRELGKAGIRSFTNTKTVWTA